jgi:ATP-dependent Clp protease ATP-binding subunit ClpA
VAKVKALPKQDPPPDSVAPDSALSRLLKAADTLRKEKKDSHISVDAIILASLQDSVLSKVYSDAGVDGGALTEAVAKMRGSKKVTSEAAETTFEALSKYGEDLVSRAEVRLTSCARGCLERGLRGGTHPQHSCAPPPPCSRRERSTPSSAAMRKSAA